MKRQTIIALAFFAALGLVYFATREPQVSVGIRKLEFSPVSADAITSIDLGGATPVKLTKETNGWSVAAAATPGTKYAADEGLVKALVDALVTLKAPDFVTERTEKHAELEVDSGKGFTIKAPSRDLVLGKSSKNGGTYLRLAASNEVFVTNGGLGYQARRSLTDWRKKAVATVKPEDLKKVTVTPAEGAAFAMENAEGTWKAVTELPKDFRFDAQAAQRLAGVLTNLSAQEFSDATDVGPGAHVIALESKDGKTTTVKLGVKQADGKRSLRVDGDAQTYVLAGWSADQLAVGLEGLRDLRVAPFELGKAQKLTFTAGGKKTVVVKEAAAWKVVEPKTLPAGVDVDVNQVPVVLGRLSNQRALKLAPAGKTVKPEVDLELELEGGQRVKLAFGGQADAATEVYARGADGLVYVVASSEKALFEKGVEAFKRPPPPPANAGMRGLDQLPPEIRAQLEAQLRQQGMGP